MPKASELWKNPNCKKTHLILSTLIDLVTKQHVTTIPRYSKYGKQREIIVYRQIFIETEMSDILVKIQPNAWVLNLLRWKLIFSLL